MCLVFGVLVGFWLAEILALAQVVLVQHRLQSFVGGFGEHALFLQNGQDAHWLQEKIPIIAPQKNCPGNETWQGQL